VNGHAGQDVIGLDLGGTFVKAARVAPDGTIGRRLREPVSGETVDELLAQLARAVATLEEDGPVPAVGLGIPGIIQRRDGCARGVPNLPAIEGLPVGDALEERCGRRAFAANDANAAALAESWLGAGRDVESMLLVTLGTGVGGGLVFDGALFTGLAGYAGEFGHIQVEPNGVRCGCDSWGCIETIAGAAGWARRADEARARRPSVLAGRTLDQEAIVDAARQGDAVALEVLEGTARALGAGIAAVLNLLNLERVVIGGGVSAAGPILLDRIVAEAKLRTFPAVFSGCSLVPAALGSDAGVVGAARVAQVGLRSVPS
jgi:glucokinase